MPKAPYRADIDGLRAVAVLLVVANHAFPMLAPGGFIGVDVFFAISGYIITSNILREHAHSGFSVLAFYDRRIRRIFPPLLTVLIASMTAGYFLLLPGDMMELGRQVAAGSAFVPNILFWSEVGYFDPGAATKPLLHLWSLGIEEQFYVVWPLLLLVLVRTRATLLLLAALAATSFIWSIATVYQHPESGFFLPLPRAWELLAGASIAVADGPIRSALAGRSVLANGLSLLGLFAIAASVFLIGRDALFPGWWALPPVVGSTCILASGRMGISGRLLSANPFPQIGLISYALYLWHWPLLVFAFIWAGGVPSTPLKLEAVAVAIIMSIASYRWIERPVRRGRSVWHVVALMIAMLATGSAGYYLSFTGGGLGHFPERIQKIADYAKYDFKSDARVRSCWLNDKETFSVYRAECFPKKDGLVVWGDSHAARLYPGLRLIFGELGQFTRNKCPAAQIGYAICTESNRQVMEAIRHIGPSTVILFGAWPNYDPAWAPGRPWDAAVERQVTELQADGRRVLLVGPAPKWTISLPNLIVSVWAQGPSTGPVPDRLKGFIDPATILADKSLRAMAQKHDVPYFSVYDAMCNADGCLTHVPGDPTAVLSWDGQHLTTPGAIFVAEKIRNAGLLTALH